MPTVHSEFWRLVRELGMTTVFGNPGSTELPFLSDFRSDMRYVLGLQEGAVVAMADGFTQVTGSPVLVNLHTAPGVGNAMGALLTARDSRAPLVVTAGNQVRAMLTARHWLVNDEPTLLPRPAVKFAYEPPRAQDLPAALARATYLAMSPPRGPVFVSMPQDDYAEQMDAEAVDDLVSRRVGTRAVPEAGALRDLADRLAAARNPALVLGLSADAAGGRADAITLAWRQHLPVYAAPSSGRSVFPSTDRLFAGYLPFGAELINEQLAGHDFVAVIGAPVFTCYPYVPSRLVPAGTQVVMVSDDPDEIARAPLGDALLADPGLVLSALAAVARSRAEATRPLPPQRARPTAPEPAGGPRPSAAEVFAALGPALPTQLRITNESPSNLADFHTYMPLTHAPCGYLTTPNGGLGYGLPAGVGAAIADPDTPVLSVVGEGSLQYTGQALWTAAQHQASVVTLVLRNDEYNILKAYAEFQQVVNDPGLDIPGLDTAAYARSYGVPGSRVDDGPEAVREAVVEALRNGGPTLIEVPIDTSVPPLV